MINRDRVCIIDEVIQLREKIKCAESVYTAKRPYHFNALLELRHDEEDISRIVAGILRHKSVNGYDVLKDFVNCFFGSELEELIETPIIDTEVCVDNLKRIDILIREEGRYAIVIENKIWDAPEQPNQLANYLEGMQNRGYDSEHIYIAYLNGSGKCIPTDKSWTSQNGFSYQDDFITRFRIINFNTTFLKWLETSDAIRMAKDKSFTDSVELFVDFLKHKMGIIKSENTMEQDVNNAIIDFLGLGENRNYNIEMLNGKIGQVRECADQLERLRRKYCYDHVTELCKALETAYPNKNIAKDFKPAQNIFTGVSISFRGEADAINVQVGFEGRNFICGAIGTSPDRSVINKIRESEEISPFYKSGEFKKGVDWLFFKRIPMEEGLEQTKTIVSRIESFDNLQL